MMEILIPIILVEEALLVKLSVLGPSVLLILSKMTYFFSGFVGQLAEPFFPSSSALADEASPYS
jgi:hypothetical protein